MIAREEVFHKATMEDLQPEITIVIPIYQAGQLVGDTCESLLAQKNVRFEALFIDAGEGVTASEIVKSYQDTRLRIQALTKSPLYALINRGTLMAQGEYINILLEGCSYLAPDSLATMLQAIRAHNSPDIFYTASYVANRIFYTKEWQQNLQQGVQPALLQSCFFKNSLFPKAGFFYQDLDRRGTLEFFCRIQALKEYSVASECRVYVEMNKFPAGLLGPWKICRETFWVIKKYFGIHAALKWFFSKQIIGLFTREFPFELLLPNKRGTA